MLLSALTYAISPTKLDYTLTLPTLHRYLGYPFLGLQLNILLPAHFTENTKSTNTAKSINGVSGTDPTDSTDSYSHHWALARVIQLVNHKKTEGADPTDGDRLLYVRLIRGLNYIGVMVWLSLFSNVSWLSYRGILSSSAIESPGLLLSCPTIL